VQSVTGVNLDEEAAKLMQWQQSYQAAAQALSVANGLFSNLLDAVKAG
jgi:flagellar hook-associated protein 1 FlgK